MSTHDGRKAVAAAMSALLAPPPGEALATHYAAKRRNKLVAVRRAALTITERARHSRRLRAAGDTKQADAMDSETAAMIWSGGLRLTHAEAARAEAEAKTIGEPK